MTNIDRRKKWIVLPVVALLIGFGVTYFAPTFGSKTARSGLHVMVDEPAVSDESVPNAGEKDRPAGPGNHRVGAELAAARPTPSKRIHPMIQSALDEHPELAQYHWLAQKVLPTQEQRRMLQEMLSDPEMIRLAKTNLLGSGETTYTQEEEAKRMLDVEFLADAFAWGDNPEIALATESVEEVLLAENISADVPDELAQSLAGDKVDLYTQLLQRAPERAAEIAKRARGTSAEPLLAYSKDWYEREVAAMRADELP